MSLARARALIPVFFAGGVHALVLLLSYAFFADIRIDSFDGPWHLTCGRIIVETGAVPRQDPLCYTAAGLDWINLNWLSQVILYRAYSALGAAGPTALASLLAAATIGLAALTLNRREVAPVIGLPIMAGLAFGLSIAHDIRPRNFSFALFSLFVFLLHTSEPRERLPWARVLILGAALQLWNQLHGGFAYGYALLGLETLGVAFASWKAGRGLFPERAWRLGLIIILGLAGFALHPHGFDALIHAATYRSRLEPFLGIIVELKPIDFSNPFGAFLEKAVFGAILGVLLSRREVEWPSLLAALFFLHMTLTIQRFLTVLLFVLAPWVGVCWTDVIARFCAGDTGPRRRLAWLNRALGPALRWLPALFLAQGLVWSGIALAQGRSGEPGALGPAFEGHGARTAIRYIADADLKGRIFNTYEIGGLMAWMLYPDRQVFIDGRGDLHAQGTAYQEYRRLKDMKPGWKALLDERGIDLVVQPYLSELVNTLIEDYGWVRHFNDRVFAIAVRPAVEKTPIGKRAQGFPPPEGPLGLATKRGD